MPIEVHWFDEAKTILHMQFMGHWNWDEYYAVKPQARELVSSIQHGHYVILDFFNGARHLPPNILTHFRKDAENAPEHRIGIIVVSKQLLLVRVFINMFTNLINLKFNVMLVSTLEEATQMAMRELNQHSDMKE